jgi:hypothetical protein
MLCCLEVILIELLSSLLWNKNLSSLHQKQNITNGQLPPSFTRRQQNWTSATPYTLLCPHFLPKQCWMDE